MDPAGPIYEYAKQDQKLMLNTNDAQHIEIHHTNTKKFGFARPLGNNQS